MGLMRFQVFPPERLTEAFAEQAYLSGLDRVPWLVRPRVENGLLVLQRSVDESANLHVPWELPGLGRIMVSTATLVQRAQPYCLPLELARGKLGQLRNQLAEWQTAGLPVPDEVPAKASEAMHHFSQAAVAQGQDAAWIARRSDQALACAVEAATMLVGCYVEQALAARSRNNGKLPTHLGGGLGVAPLDEPTMGHFLEAFNAASVPLAWSEIESVQGLQLWNVSDRQIQWCRKHALNIYGGPLLQFDHRTIPEWLYDFHGDFENIQAFACHFVEAVVQRFRGQVHLWQCVGRMQNADLLGLSEEHTLRLTARVIELLRTLDPDTPVVMSFDQPWGEYLARRDLDFPPLHFADALIRSGLGLSGLLLELNLGYYPGGTLPRDVLELSRQLDHWAGLGLPLHVALCVPSSAHEDPLASRRVKLPAEWTSDAQHAWISRYVPLLLAKPYVQGVLWSQLRDCEPHEFPNGGLIDLRRHPKPSLGTLAALRQAHLK